MLISIIVLKFEIESTNKLVEFDDVIILKTIET